MSNKIKLCSEKTLNTFNQKWARITTIVFIGVLLLLSFSLTITGFHVADVWFKNNARGGFVPASGIAKADIIAILIFSIFTFLVAISFVVLGILFFTKKGRNLLLSSLIVGFIHWLLLIATLIIFTVMYGKTLLGGGEIFTITFIIVLNWILILVVGVFTSLTFLGFWKNNYKNNNSANVKQDNSNAPAVNKQITASEQPKLLGLENKENMSIVPVQAKQESTKVVKPVETKKQESSPVISTKVESTKQTTQPVQDIKKHKKIEDTTTSSKIEKRF